MCSTPFYQKCFNDNAPGRKQCHKCRSQRYRERNQLAATYDNLRSHARERGIPFEVTIKGWRAFCNRTGYLKLRGRLADSMVVDRHNPMIGYTNKNIRPLTNVQNVRKQHTFDAITKLKGTYKGKEKFKYVKPIDQPF